MKKTASLFIASLFFICGCGSKNSELIETTFKRSFDKNLIPEETTKPPTAEEENELLKKINELLDQKVRPALAGDGGGLEVLGVDGFTVSIRYQGACGSCPSAISGTLMAIEGLLRRDINPAIEVVAA